MFRSFLPSRDLFRPFLDQAKNGHQDKEEGKVSQNSSPLSLENRCCPLNNLTIAQRGPTLTESPSDDGQILISRLDGLQSKFGATMVVGSGGWRRSHMPYTCDTKGAEKPHSTWWGNDGIRVEASIVPVSS